MIKNRKFTKLIQEYENKVIGYTGFIFNLTLKNGEESADLV